MHSGYLRSNSVAGPRAMPEPTAAQRLLAFDFGLRRIGVAVGQTITGSARELTTVQWLGDEPDWAGIEQLIDEWEPNLLLVGLPVNADGEDTEQCAAVREFAAALAEDYALPVQLIDEHLTSREAERTLAEQRRSGGRRRRVRKADVDALSAVLIAEQWLRQRDIARR